jgi:hypothetical protein
MEVIDAAMKWIVAPVAAFVWLIYQRQQDHHTDIQVIKSQMVSTKESADRDRTEMKDITAVILKKLDTIEEYLRTHK